MKNGSAFFNETVESFTSGDSNYMIDQSQVGVYLNIRLNKPVSNDHHLAPNQGLPDSQQKDSCK